MELRNQRFAATSQLIVSERLRKSTIILKAFLLAFSQKKIIKTEQQGKKRWSHGLLLRKFCRASLTIPLFFIIYMCVFKAKRLQEIRLRKLEMQNIKKKKKKERKGKTEVEKDTGIHKSLDIKSQQLKALKAFKFSRKSKIKDWNVWLKSKVTSSL